MSFVNILWPFTTAKIDQKHLSVKSQSRIKPFCVSVNPSLASPILVQSLRKKVQHINVASRPYTYRRVARLNGDVSRKKSKTERESRQESRRGKKFANKEAKGYKQMEKRRRDHIRREEKFIVFEL